MASDITNVDQNVKSINQHIAELTAVVSGLSESFQASQTQYDSLQSDFLEIKNHNKTLTDQNSALLKEIAALKSNDIHSNVKTQPTKSLLIGSSLIRNLDEAKLGETTVSCMRGAVMADIRDKLENYAKSVFFLQVNKNRSRWK